MSTRRIRTRLFVLAAALAAALGVMLSTVTSPLADAAALRVQSRSSTDVTADALPTVQIDGVVWTQVVVGNTVYAGGRFGYARPAGAAPDQQRTRRYNILAFDIRTGELVTTFAPKVNGVVHTLAKSPDGKTLYLGGEFTSVNGSKRSRFAAVSTDRGALRGIAPAFNSHVRVIMAVGDKVFVGGSFTRVGKAKRSRLAVLNARTGKVGSWAPKADNYVRAMTVTPDRKSVVVGGAFRKLNKTSVYGMGKLSVKSGKVRSWAASSTIRNYGQKSAITSLTTDGVKIYGSGYKYGGGNYEGAFALDPRTGRILWLQDCRGDTYQVAVANNRVYSVGHAHNCQSIGAFGEVKPLAYRVLAATTNATGKVVPNSNPSYNEFVGRPAPSLVNWFPELTPGSFTGQSQAAWSVVATGSYVVLGGEFTAVNGVRQQGLVRFPAQRLAPNKQGPFGTGSASAPSVETRADGTATIRWRAGYDRDDQNLSYTVLRNGVAVGALSAVSQFWNRPNLSFIDAGLKAGTKYKYEVLISDPDSNTAVTGSTTVITAAAAQAPAAAAPDDTSTEEMAADADSPSTPVPADGQ